MKEFSELIIKWYNLNKRDLPWRRTTNPYEIWISEIILQQTRVDQGLSYYNEFIRKFPDITALRKAEESAVLNVVKGIGYYRRFLNLQDSVEQIFNVYNGTFPSTFNELQKLKGVGSYTAAAIASFAFKESVPVVDGNVYRVLSRYFADNTPIDTSKGKKVFFNFAEKLIDQQRPDIFNQAIMELGALICKSVKPFCENCPINKQCTAYNNNSVGQYPVKSKLKNKKTRYLSFLDIRVGNEILLEKRLQNDIWKNMYCLPAIETNKEGTDQDIFNSDLWKSFFLLNKNNELVSKKKYKHVLTHQVINATFFKIHIKKKINFEKRGCISVTVNNIDDYPLPRLIEKYFQNE